MKQMLVGVSIIALVAASVYADDKKNPCATPLGPTPGQEKYDRGWTSRHKSLVERAKKGGIDVIFLGDSAVFDWENNGKKVWAANFDKLKAANFGIRNELTQKLLWRITDGKELEGVSPKVAVLMIGFYNTFSFSPEQTAEGVGAIVSTLRKKNIKVLLLGIFPRVGQHNFFFDDPKKSVIPAADVTFVTSKIKQTNDIIKKLDDGKNIVYMDIGPKFLTEDGGLSRDIMPNLESLSEKGYQIWADAITPKLQEMLK